MEYILGKLTIMDRLKLNRELIDSEIIYYGAADEPPAGLVSPFSTKALSGSSVICQITSIVPGRVLGRYCWVAFPATYGKLLHIYSIYEKGSLTIDLLDSWECVNTTVNKKQYYLYYQTKRTKDSGLSYKFIWNNNN